jgi:hypothetical protein
MKQRAHINMFYFVFYVIFYFIMRYKIKTDPNKIKNGRKGK